jgi:glycosyltransferase involved in cell wall biosynthesis
MNILWVTNSILPELSLAMGKKPSPFGGWQIGLANKLISNGVLLTIVTARKNCKRVYHTNGNINYYLLSSNKSKGEYDKNLGEQWKDVIKQVNPDLVHIHGSEHAHGLVLVKTFPELNYVLSIQGLISVYSRYYKASLGNLNILRNLTLRDLLKNDGIWASQKEFRKRGERIEKEYFLNVTNIIGRTDWDYAHAKAMNSSANYFFCNEALRDSFYQNPKWSFENISQQTIFLSQANYPIKGIHQALKALAIVKVKFPKVKLVFAGSNILQQETGIKNAIKLKGYGKLLKNMVRKLSLEGNIEYLGVLSETEMKKAYLDSHIFLCPSSIENSPNSVAEAQILGVPTISSYVGGSPNMITHNVDGMLYRFEEVEQLANYIEEIFTDTKLCLKLSENAIKTAEKRHDKSEITNTTISIYKEILQKS